MKTKSKLTFKRKCQKKHPGICSADRTYLDYTINGKSLSELLGGVGGNIGNFGWKVNVKYELNEFEKFKSGISSFENGLFSAYVCAECGDEGCGAVMFRIIETENTIEWKDFVWSDGCIDEDFPDEKIEPEYPIIFNKNEYYEALSELKRKILEKEQKKDNSILDKEQDKSIFSGILSIKFIKHLFGNQIKGSENK